MFLIRKVHWWIQGIWIPGNPSEEERVKEIAENRSIILSLLQNGCEDVNISLCRTHKSFFGSMSDQKWLGTLPALAIPGYS